MKVYIPRNLLADSKEIEALQRERQAIQDSLNRARNRLNYLEGGRSRIQQRIDGTKAAIDRLPLTLPRPEAKALATDENIRKYQQEQLEVAYQERLAAARKPYLEQLKFLETELAEWERAHGKDMESLKKDIGVLEKRCRDLDIKLKDFIAVEGDDLLS